MTNKSLNILSLRLLFSLPDQTEKWSARKKKLIDYLSLNDMEAANEMTTTIVADPIAMTEQLYNDLQIADEMLVDLATRDDSTEIMYSQLVALEKEIDQIVEVTGALKEALAEV